MKQEYVRRIAFLSVIICLLFLVSSCTKYPVGKDIALYAGDARFQVLHGVATKYDEDTNSYTAVGTEYILYDSENESFQRKVTEYYIDEKTKKLYLIGEAGYSVIDYAIDRYEEHKKVEDCTQEDQAIFREESKFTVFDPT